MPGGQLVGYFGLGPRQVNVLALGEGTAVCLHVLDHRRPLMRHDPDGPAEELLPEAGDYLAPVLGGFVVQDSGHGVWLGAATGSLTRVGLPVTDSSAAVLFAADPVSGQLAFHDHGSLLLLEPDGRLLARGELGRTETPRGVFVAPGHLITLNRDNPELESWRRAGTKMVRAAEVRLDPDHDIPFVDVRAVPGHDLVLALQRDAVRWLDTGTLDEAGAPPGFSDWARSPIAFSRDGALAAVTVEARGVVHHLGLRRLAELTDRPLVELTPSAMETVATLGNLTRTGQEARVLVRVALEYRFGTDVALGSDTRIASRADDIALGGG